MKKAICLRDALDLNVYALQRHSDLHLMNALEEASEPDPLEITRAELDRLDCGLNLSECLCD